VKDSPVITSFNGGELSPFIAGRVDVAKYSSGCERMDGFLPLVEGPAISCPGFRYVAEVKNSAHRTWLVRFEFSETEAWVLEFGDRYIRFFTNRGQVQTSGVAAWATTTAYTVGDLRTNGGVVYYCAIAHTSGVFNTDLGAAKWYAMPGTVYEIPSPYAIADLTNPDGTFALRYGQTGDVVYLTHGSYAVRKLVRYAATRWILSIVSFEKGPFEDLNTGAITIQANVATGTVTLTASANLFTALDVGRYIALEQAIDQSDQRWEAFKPLVTAGNSPVGFVMRAGNNWYRCATDQVAVSLINTGTVMPTHTEGIQADGNGLGVSASPNVDRAGVDWEYLHSGMGIVLITGYTSATVVTGTVTTRLPDKVVSAATKRWAWGAWNATAGHPTAVTFFRERLTFARDASIWFSVVGDFENFSTKIGGVQTADAGFDKTLASGRLNAIKWMSPGDVLLIGTMGDEFVMAEQTNGSAFSNANCKIEPQSVYGSADVDVARVGDATLFVQRGGKTMRSASFSAEKNRYLSDDVTAFASHLLKPGVIDVAYQQNPWRVLWCARTDGVLAGLVFNVEQSVVAWFRRGISGAVVECVEVIPAPVGARDDLWIVARLTINGVTKRYVAYLEAEEDENTAQADWFYVDMGATYSGVPTVTISGLSYLEGKEVWVLANGASHPARTVVGGQITLNAPASKVQVGLPNWGYLQPMPINAGARQPAGKIKRVHAVVLRLLRSLGGRAGPDEATAGEIRYRLPAVPMGSAPPPFTGDVEVEWDADYDRKQSLLMIRDKPMPMTVVAVMPELNGSEGR
jgi:hypothetical protein